MKGVLLMSKIKVTEQCVCCGANVEIEVYEKDYIEYTTTPIHRRRHIQDIFPYLTPQDREMFISNICPVCYDDMFLDEEDVSAEDLKEWQDASCGRC